MVFIDQSILAPAGGGSTPPFDGFSPILGYNLTDEDSVVESSGTFVSASPVAESQTTGDLTVSSGGPSYVTGSGAAYVQLIPDSGVAALQSISGAFTPPANRDQTVLAIFEKGQATGYCWDCQTPRTSAFLDSNTSATGVIGGSTFAPTAITNSLGVVYGMAVTGSVVDQIDMVIAELGTTAVKTDTSWTPSDAVNYPSNFLIGTRHSGASQQSNMKLWGWARFDYILPLSEIQTIYDRFDAIINP